MKHLYKILALILSLAMLLTITAMAAEPEVETCEDGCVHDHEDAAAPAALEWECSSHNIRMYSETRILSVTSTHHTVQYVAVEECTNSGCSYKMEYPRSSVTEEHTAGPICTVCFHASSRRKAEP